jgi:hypothetical protein
MMKPVRSACALILFALVSAEAAAQGQSPTVTIKVADKRKAPVSSSLYLNPGMLPIGKTSSSGEYRFKHKCEIGQTFKAQPDDRGQFYDSEDQVCGQLVELEVFPRPALAVKKSEVELFKVGEWQGFPVGKPVYAGVFGGVVDKVETLPGGRNGRCRLTLDKRYSVGVYNSSTDTWRKLEEIKPTVTGAIDDSVFVFPSTCEESQPKILELRQRAQIEMRDGTKTLSVSPDVGADVQKAIRGLKF